MPDIEREQAIAEQAAKPLEYPGLLPLIETLRQEHGDWVRDVVQAFGEITLIVPREQIVAVCQYMKTTAGLEFNLLADICGADRGPEEEPRFEVNYHLFSTTKYHRLRLKVLLHADDDLDGPAAPFDA